MRLDIVKAVDKVLRIIAGEASENPEIVKTAPHNTPVRRLDDTKAALEQIVTYQYE